MKHSKVFIALIFASIALVACSDSGEEEPAQDGVPPNVEEPTPSDQSTTDAQTDRLLA